MKSLLKKLVSKHTLCAATVLISSSIASAQTYSYNVQDYTTSSSISVIDDFTLTYNTSNETLQLDVSYANQKPDGFWLVVSDGENPKSNADEYAIFYFDATDTTPVVTAYVYDGINGPDSYQSGSLLDSTLIPGSNITASVSQAAGGGDAFSLTVDASSINAAALGTDWDGAQFGEKVGIWFHTFTTHSDPTYGRDGGLDSLSIKKNNYLDLVDEKTELVPEPSSALLLSLSSMLIMFRRKRYN